MGGVSSPRVSNPDRATVSSTCSGLRQLPINADPGTDYPCEPLYLGTTQDKGKCFGACHQEQQHIKVATIGSPEGVGARVHCAHVIDASTRRPPSRFATTFER